MQREFKGISVFREPTSTDRKASAFHSMTHTDCVNCYSESMVDQLINFTYAAPITNKLKTIYKNHKVDVAFVSEKKLKSVLCLTKEKVDRYSKEV